MAARAICRARRGLIAAVAAPAPRLLSPLLASYGLCMGAAGLAMILAPAWANRLEAGTSSIFVEHLAQSRGAAVLALGVIALLAARDAGRQRWILLALATSSALFAGLFLMVQLSPVAAPYRWIAVLLCTLWAAGFAWQSADDAGEGERQSWRDPSRLLLISFALWTGITGLLWLVAPGGLGAQLETLAGQGAGYFAMARGAVDLPLGWLAWSARDQLRLPVALPVIAGVFVANAALSVAGFIAQMESIATPSRWAVELLHIVWTIGAAAIGWRLLRAGKRAVQAW